MDTYLWIQRLNKDWPFIQYHFFYSFKIEAKEILDIGFSYFITIISFHFVLYREYYTKKKQTTKNGFKESDENGDGEEEEKG